MSHLWSIAQQKLFEKMCAEEKIEKSEDKEAFKEYASLLVEWNKRFNLTAITDIRDIIVYHFQDSLRIQHTFDMTRISTIGDVGTGAGFPAIPLKIRFPHLKMVLIEVNGKKRSFLQEVITRLGLDNIEISDLDWRTFLRTTDYAIDLFISRASLSPDELVRALQPGCFYRNAMILYWSSTQWTGNAKVQPYIVKECAYKVGNRQGKYVFLAKSQKESE